MSELYPKSKFMKIIWTFNGIAFALLLVLTLPTVLREFIRSDFNFFTDPTHEQGLIVGKKADKAGELNVDLQHLIYDRPTRIDSTNFYYTSVVVMDKKLPKDIKDMINSAADISIYMVGASINMIFFNEDRSVVRRLLPKNGYINDYIIGGERYSYSNNEKSFFPFALYRIALKDDNGDSRINSKDSMPYYLSNLDGTNLRQITPDSLELDSYWFSDNYNEIYFDEIIEDKNSPLVFENYYEKTRKVYYYNLNTNEFGLFEALQNEFNNIQSSFEN